MVDLYDLTHARRPWTQERPADWNRLVPRTTWRPGSEILVAETEGTLAGYAIMAGRSFGDGYFGLTVEVRLFLGALRAHAGPVLN